MNNRDMFYQNYNAGGFANPNMMPLQQPMMQPQPMMMPQPSGFNINSQYQTFGPNVVPEQMGYNTGYMENDYEQRLSKCEKQIRRLDSRVSKLEDTSKIMVEENNNENLFMI